MKPRADSRSSSCSAVKGGSGVTLRVFHSEMMMSMSRDFVRAPRWRSTLAGLVDAALLAGIALGVSRPRAGPGRQPRAGAARLGRRVRARADRAAPGSGCSACARSTAGPDAGSQLWRTGLLLGASVAGPAAHGASASRRAAGARPPSDGDALPHRAARDPRAPPRRLPRAAPPSAGRSTQRHTVDGLRARPDARDGRVGRRRAAQPPPAPPPRPDRRGPRPRAPRLAIGRRPAKAAGALRRPHSP